MLVLITGIRFYMSQRKLKATLQYLDSEHKRILQFQQGMTFKFQKINGRFIHTFCDGELAYKLRTPPKVSIGKELKDFIHDNDYVAFKESYYERAWNGENVSYEGELNGVWYVAVLSPVILDDQVTEVIASCVDITKQKMIEHELRESEQMYRLIAQSSSDLIQILRRDMTIRYASPSHENILGYNPLDIEQKTATDRVLSEDKMHVEQWFKELLTQKNTQYQTMFRVQHKNGSTLTLEVQAGLIFDNSTRPVGAVLISRDATRRILEEKRNTEVEKLTLAGQLAAGIAHEIRNPLTAVKGFINLLHTPSEHQMFYTQIIETELLRIEDIVNELLTLAKPEAIKFSRCDLQVLVSNVITLLTPLAMIQKTEIHFSKSPKETSVYGSKNQLKQVFINLIKNAIESMGSNGNVYISIEDSLDNVIVRIKDEGSGIPKEALEHVGNPFYTTKENGTGLGLMVCYNIINQHNGRIHLQSTLDKGTCVEVMLPKVTDDTAIVVHAT